MENEKARPPLEGSRLGIRLCRKWIRFSWHLNDISSHSLIITMKSHHAALYIYPRIFYSPWIPGTRISRRAHTNNCCPHFHEEQWTESPVCFMTQQVHIMLPQEQL